MNVNDSTEKQMQGSTQRIHSFIRQNDIRTLTWIPLDTDSGKFEFEWMNIVNGNENGGLCGFVNGILVCL